MGGNRLFRVLSVLTDNDKGLVDDFHKEANNPIRQIAELPLSQRAEESLSDQISRLTPTEKEFAVKLSGREAPLRRLASDLKLELIENGFNPVDMASSGLGYTNLIYMATMVLQLTEVAHYDLTLFLVEEPEAHLHPQLQATLLNYLQSEAKILKGKEVEAHLTPPAGFRSS